MTYQELEKTLYTFYFKVQEVIDGDSIRGTIDRAFNDSSSKRSVRLARIDAWEKTGIERKEGLEATNYVKSLIKPGDKIIIRSLGEDNFGRVVSEVFVNIDGESVNLSDRLVAEKHAVYKDYKGLKKY